MILRTFSGTLALALFLATASPVLAQFERVDVITLPSGETGLLSAVIDPDGAFAYFGAQGDPSPASIVKIDLETFARVDAISLLAVEGTATSAVMDPDGAFAYFGTSSIPARVVKVDLETFQRVGSITLESGEGALRSAVIDPEGAFAYFGTTTSTLSDDVGDRVVKVDLETFERDDAITLEDFEDELLTAVIDPNGAFAYFGTNTPTVSRGEVVKIDLETFQRVGSISTDNGEGNPSSAVVSPDGTTAYFGAGTSTNPVRIIQVDLETFERAGTITLETISGSSTSAVISPSGAFAYFGTLTSPGRVVKVDLETFELVDTITLESGENNLRSAVAGSNGEFSYFGTWSNDPGRVIKIQLGEESPPGGGTRYVDGGTGSDTSDCADELDPCATISYAIDQAVGGDTIEIAPGEYTEPLTIGKSLTLNGAGQEPTTIQAHEEPGQGAERTVTIEEGLEVAISDVTIRHGVSFDNGGGIYNNESALDLTNVTFFRNLALANGAGLYNLNASGTFRNVTFVENIAFGPSENNRGGGMYNDGSSPTLINVLIMECVASLEGGGMYNANSSPTLINVTLSRNFAGIEAGGGMYNLNSTPTLTNSIVWGNMAADPEEGVGNEIYNDGDSSVELFYSLYGNDEGDIEEGGGFTAVNSQTDDPLFVDAENRNLRLQSGSPAIDAGDPATDLEPFPTNENGDPIDLDGNPRIFDEGIDIGAYETQGIVADDASPEEITQILGAPNPNPVGGVATFTVAVERGQNVTVELFDALGRRVQTLYEGALAAGTNETLTLDASSFPAGVYVIRAVGEDFMETRRLTIAR